MEIPGYGHVLIRAWILRTITLVKDLRARA